ncbi:unnamed protein product [Closterium sp. Naga37s-1]|nr:unnamed protein product [Closterium sp. Naga37s-1]
MSKQAFNTDLTMTAAEEEALAESGEDLLVEDLPKGLIDELTCSPDHPAAKKACMDAGAGHTSINSPATSSDSALAQPPRSPMPLAAAAPASPSSSPMPTPAATAASPNAPALHAAAYASVIAGVNPAPALPASLFASPAPGGSPRNLRRARTATATPMLLPLRRRVVVTLLLPEAVLESHRTELLAGINAFKAFTAAKAAGAPTLSIRNVPLEFDPEDIRASLLGTTDEDGAHWLADPTDFHRASDPYEDTFFTHLAGLPVATPDDPNFERIPSEILLESNKPAMLLNFSCHVCSLCGNNHRASDHEAFAARRRGRLTNKNTISIAQLQQANGTKSVALIFSASILPSLSSPPTLNPAFPTPPHSFHPPPSQGPNCNRPQRSDRAARPPTWLPPSASSPLPPVSPTLLSSRPLHPPLVSSPPPPGLPNTPAPSPRLPPLPAPPSSRCHLAHMVLPLSVLTLTSPSCPTPPTLPPPLIPAPLSTPSPPLLPPPPPNTNPIQSPLPPPPSPQPHWSPPTPALTPCCSSLPKSPPYPLPCCFPPRTAARAPANPTFNLTLPTPLAPPIPLPAPGAPPHPAFTPVTHLSPTALPSPAPHVVGLLLTLPPSPHHPTLPALSNPCRQPSLPGRSALATNDGPPPSHTLTPHPHSPPALPPPRRPHFLTEPLALFPSNTPPTLGAFPPRVSPEDGPAAHPHAGTETLPSPSLSPLFLTAPSPTSPTPRLLPSPPSLPIPLLSPLHPPLVSSPPPTGLPNTPAPSPRLSPLPAPPSSRCHLAHPPSRSSPSPSSPAPPLQLSLLPLFLHIRPPPRPPCSPLLPPTAPSLAGNLLGTHAAPTAFRNDPGLLYIGLDDWVEYWTCALCDFTCGAALDSAMEHIQSDLHATRVKASAHRPAAKDDFGPWRALILLQQKAPVTAFLRGRP